MKPKIEIHYHGGGEEYPVTTELINKTYQETGFIPVVGDQIFLETEDIGEVEKEQDVDTVTVVKRWIAYTHPEKQCIITLHISFQNVIPALIDEEAPGRRFKSAPDYFYSGN